MSIGFKHSSTFVIIKHMQPSIPSLSQRAQDSSAQLFTQGYYGIQTPQQYIAYNQALQLYCAQQAAYGFPVPGALPVMMPMAYYSPQQLIQNYPFVGLPAFEPPPRQLAAAAGMETAVPAEVPIDAEVLDAGEELAVAVLGAGRGKKRARDPCSDDLEHNSSVTSPSPSRRGRVSKRQRTFVANFDPAGAVIVAFSAADLELLDKEKIRDAIFKGGRYMFTGIDTVKSGQLRLVDAYRALPDKHCMRAYDWCVANVVAHDPVAQTILLDFHWHEPEPDTHARHVYSLKTPFAASLIRPLQLANCETRYCVHTQSSTLLVDLHKPEGAECLQRIVAAHAETCDSTRFQKL